MTLLTCPPTTIDEEEAVDVVASVMVEGNSSVAFDHDTARRLVWQPPRREAKPMNEFTVTFPCAEAICPGNHLNVVTDTMRRYINYDVPGVKTYTSRRSNHISVRVIPGEGVTLDPDEIKQALTAAFVAVRMS